MNKTLAVHVLQAFLDAGGMEICVCSGSRNAPLVSLVAAHPHIKAYYFYEERSAAFFALGLARRSGRPAAIITTSGTAAVELMPAIAEGYYSGVPLVAITADRPRSYRGSNAPQACEQVGLYGIYARWCADVEGSERLDLSSWDRRSPAHINVCFSEPLQCEYQGDELKCREGLSQGDARGKTDLTPLRNFLLEAKHPLAVIGALEPAVRDGVRKFLRRLNIPVYAEGPSGLREEPSLDHLRVCRSSGLRETAARCGYPIDGILRIGRVPTVRLWRDLEDLEGKVRVCSVSDVPFSGLSWGQVIDADLATAFDAFDIPAVFSPASYAQWRTEDAAYQRRLEVCFGAEPAAECSLVHQLAARLPDGAFIFLGNSLPVRNWDLAAPYRSRGFEVKVTRGLSGIDGQVSTFLGLCTPARSNWALMGDLTALYDMAGFWIAAQLRDINFNVVVINNGGGQIFSRMYREPAFINAHSLNFKGLADLWNIEYERWEEVPDVLPAGGHRLIELAADNAAHKRFWELVQ